jgi:hypothetical protein
MTALIIPIDDTWEEASGECAGRGGRAALVTPLGTRPVAEDRTVLAVFERLAFENAAVFEIQMKDIAFCAVRHRVELHEHRVPGRDRVERVADAPQGAMTAMQTPDAADRLGLRHAGHPVENLCKRRARRREAA